MMPPVIVIVMYMLAVARGTTLITHDEITRPMRAAFVRRFDPRRLAHRWVMYLLGPDDDATGCPWCVSIWVGSVTAPIVWWWGGSPAVLVPVIALATSQVTGMIYIYGRR